MFRSIRVFGAIVLALHCSAVSTVNAEIHQCDGKWTNLPCTGVIESEIKEAQRARHVETTEAPEGEVENGASTSSAMLDPLAPRSDLARKLRKLNDEFKSKGGVTLSKAELDGFRRYCEERTRTIDECQTRFTEQSQRLTELNQKKDKLDIEAERNQIEADKVKAIRGH